VARSPKEQLSKTFFFSQVKWKKSDVKFEDRFDKYLDPSFFQHRVSFFFSEKIMQFCTELHNTGQVASLFDQFSRMPLFYNQVEESRDGFCVCILDIPRGVVMKHLFSLL
jgi:hypothetical protein